MAGTKNTGEIPEAVVGNGREELDRASLGPTFSGFAAGLNISFSAVALAVVGALTGGVGLAAYLAYPLGFLYGQVLGSRAKTALSGVTDRGD